MDTNEMIRFDKALSMWGTPEFEPTLKQLLVQEADCLPLQQGLSTGNYVSDTPITVSIQSVVEKDNLIRVRAGIFYRGVIGGCSCTDDPTPVSDINEYCEVQLDIDKSSAITCVTLIND